jgi:LmbE family N-acetylglucosaminyl deacetylase
MPAIKTASKPVQPLVENDVIGLVEITRHTRILAQCCRRLLSAASAEVAETELGRSALVFSPHPDDESLACGGTIIKKKRAGASVKLVHMTDGSGSHDHIISKQELKAIRKGESLEAARVLGVDGTYFLDFEDRMLSENIAAAAGRVLEIFRQEKPEEVFVPYCQEPNRQAADHVAATKIVLAALGRHQRRVTVWEYPVWFWLHWPWVGLGRSCPPIRRRHVFKNCLRWFFGARAFVDLRYSVDIADVREKKLAALAEHKSQMQQLLPDPRWATLGQVANGDFLECFQQDREFFRRYTFKPAYD